MKRRILEYWNVVAIRRKRARHWKGVFVVLGIIVVGLIFLLGLFLAR